MISGPVVSLWMQLSNDTDCTAPRKGNLRTKRSGKTACMTPSRDTVNSACVS